MGNTIKNPNFKPILHEKSPLTIQETTKILSENRYQLSPTWVQKVVHFTVSRDRYILQFMVICMS